MFESVWQKTGKSVVVVIDTNPSQKSSTDVDQSSAENYSPIARRFVREVKYLVGDRQIMHCLFASPEGGGFQVVARKKRRLEIFQILELPKSIAEEYLSNK